ncbi:MAG: hypothetical protein FWG87_08775 [Defluviitaleaceae bacterium]|nr:hypothetical protein [Defluviitaleaceae bacterium]
MTNKPKRLTDEQVTDDTTNGLSDDVLKMAEAGLSYEYDEAQRRAEEQLREIKKKLSLNNP